MDTYIAPVSALQEAHGAGHYYYAVSGNHQNQVASTKQQPWLISVNLLALRL